MKSRDTAPEKRALLSLARSYRAKGYEVTVPSLKGPLPIVLDGYIPDLVAQSSNDNVVVEIKRAGAIRGANDLVWLSRKIEALENWRLELVTVASTQRLIRIDHETEEYFRRELDSLLREGLFTAAFLMLWTHVEANLASVAADNDINPANRSLPKLTSDMNRSGFFTRGIKEALDAAWLTRSTIAHESGRASAADVDRLLATSQAFLDDVLQAHALRADPGLA